MSCVNNLEHWKKVSFFSQDFLTKTNCVSQSCNMTEIQKPDHFPAVRNKVDEEKLKSLWQKGSKAWIDVHNPAEWVETMRKDETWDSLWEKGGHEWITEHTPHTGLENDPENHPWKEL